MIRTFVEVPLFTKRWKEIQLGDEELYKLQIIILKKGLRCRLRSDLQLQYMYRRAIREFTLVETM